MLSPQGVLYMVLVQENKPKQVQALLAQLDLDMKVPISCIFCYCLLPLLILIDSPCLALHQIVCRTKAVNEQLMIVKVTRKAADSRTDS